MADKVYYVWMGSAREVFKPAIKMLFKRGVPAEAPALFADLLEKDPLFVKMDTGKAEEVLKAYKDAKDIKAFEIIRKKTVKELEGKYKENLQAHYKERGRPPKKGPVAKSPERTLPSPSPSTKATEAKKEPEKAKPPEVKKPKGMPKKPEGGD